MRTNHRSILSAIAWLAVSAGATLHAVTVTTLSPADGTLVAGPDIEVDVTFSEAVVGVDSSDLSVSMGTVGTPEDRGDNTWRFHISGLGPGTLDLTLPATADGIEDGAGNDLVPKDWTHTLGWFEEFQAIEVLGATYVAQFTIDGTPYLAMGADDTHEETVDPVRILAWDSQAGNFSAEPLQELPALGCMGLTTVAIEGTTYLLVADRRAAQYVLYRWASGGTRFVEYQRFAIPAGQAGHFFRSGGHVFLGLASPGDDWNVATESVIYKWDSEQTRFIERWRVETTGALGWEFLRLAEGEHLVCRSVNTSVIAPWDAADGPGTFAPFPSQCSAGLSSFNSDAETYVVASDGNYNVPDETTTVYQWTGGDPAFEVHQQIATIDDFGNELLTVGEELFCAIPEYAGPGPGGLADSRILRWDGDAQQFLVFQSIETKGAFSWHAFTVGGRQFLAVANHDYNAAIDSVIYEWNGPLPTVDLTVVSGTGGRVSGPGEGTFPYPTGTEVGLVATAEPGYRFAGWTGPVADPTRSETTVTLDADKTVRASFVALTLDDGLVAHYPFTDADVAVATDNVAVDATGNGHDGTISDAIPTADRHGTPNAALDFPGTSEVTIPYAPELAPQTFSVSLWMKTDSVQPGGSGVLASPMAGDIPGDGTQYGWSVGYWDNGAVGFAIDPSIKGDGEEPFTQVLSDMTADDNGWRHIVCIYDGTLHMYVDGVPQSREAAGHYLPTGSDLILGNTPFDSEYYHYDGALDDFRLYNRVLSAVEIAELYTGVKGMPVDMVSVAGGTFTMGDTWGDGEADEKPTHEVTLSPFYVGKTEVTNAEMARVMQWAYDNGHTTATAASVQNVEGTAHEFWATDPADRGISFADGTFTIDVGKENHPANGWTWYGAAAYCNGRGAMEGRPLCYDLSDWSCDWTAQGYRLPTEAEWEYAARGGADGQDTKYSGSDTIGDVAWYDANSGGTPHQVGTKAPNELGAYDMSGNVWEWCHDWRGDYTAGPQIDPRGPETGTYHIVRGGSWVNPADDHRLSERNAIEDGGARYATGLRPVLPAVDLDTGLIAYYPFDGDAQDVSGNQNHGTVQEAALAEDRHGNPNSAYEFDGVDDYIDVSDSDSLDTDTTFAVTCWFRCGDLAKVDTIGGVEAQAIVTYGDDNVDGKNNPIVCVEGKLTWSVRGQDAQYDDLIGTTSLADGTWYHAAVTYDGATAMLYLDGGLEDARAVTMQMDSNSRIWVGGYHNPSNNAEHYFFQGSVDDVRIYDRALSPAEIRALYEGETDPTADTTPPTVTARNPAPDSTITSASFNVDVTFSEPVRNVTADDLVLSGNAAGSRAAEVGSPVHQGNNTWRFPITGLVNGTLTLTLAPDANDIEDLAGNDLAQVQWEYDVHISNTGLLFSDWAPLNSYAGSDSSTVRDDSQALATDGNGNWVAVWDSMYNPATGTTGSDFDVWLARSSDNGQTWSDAQSMPGNTSRAEVSPLVATDGQGVWLVVWQSAPANGHPADWAIRFARSTDNGETWSAPAPVNPDGGLDGADGLSPDALVNDGAGNWLATWRRLNADDSWDGIISRSTDDGQTWNAPVTLQRLAGGSNGVRLTTDRKGLWVAVCEYRDDTWGLTNDTDIFLATSTDNGATWTGDNIEHLVSPPVYQEYFDERPFIATDGSGRWVVLWTTYYRGDGVGRCVRSVDNGATWSASSGPGGHYRVSGLTANRFGRFAACLDRGGTYVLSASTDYGLTWAEDLLPPLDSIAGRSTLVSDGGAQWLLAHSSEDTLGGTVGDDHDILYATATLPRADDVPPLVVQRVPEPGTMIATGSIDIDVTFIEEVQGVDASDLVLSGTATSSHLIVIIPTRSTRAVEVGTPTHLGGNTWRFPVTGLIDGTLTVDLAPESGDIQDMAGNDLAPLQWSHPVDVIAPHVSSRTPVPDAVINESCFSLDVVFSEPVVGVDASDLVLAGEAAIRAEVGTPEDLGYNTWCFPVLWLVSGPLEITLAPDADDIEDAAGHDLPPQTWSYTVTLPVMDLTVSGARALYHTSDSIYYPIAEADGSGGWVTAWLHSGRGGTFGDDKDILSRRTADSAHTWSGTIPVNSDAATDHEDEDPEDMDRFVDIVSDRNGTMLAVWETRRDTIGDALHDTAIAFAVSHDTGATWSAPAPLHSPENGGNTYPAAATDGLGHWVVTWERGNESRAVCSDDNGQTWTPPLRLLPGARFTRVATDGNGLWLAVFEVSGEWGGDTDIAVATSTDNGVTWSPIRALNSNAWVDTGADVRPHIATDGAGQWVVVWITDDSLGGAIGEEPDIVCAYSRDDGSTWSPPCPLVLDQNDTRRAMLAEGHYSLDLAADDAGRFVAAWCERDDTILGGPGYYAIWHAVSASGGAEWNSAPLTGSGNPLPDGHDYHPAIATDDAGRWMITWLHHDMPTTNKTVCYVLGAEPGCESVAPDVTARSPAPDATVNAGQVNIDVTFSEVVTGVDASDLVLGGSAWGGFWARQDEPVHLGDDRWQFPVWGLGDGTLTVSLAPDAGDITDLAGNDLAAMSWEYTVTVPPRTLRVDHAATGAGTGLTWADAFTDLQSALDLMRSGDSIWVASGTYTPSKRTDAGDPRSATFVVPSGVSLIGGFAGTETTTGQRVAGTGPVVLSGDLGTAGDSADNAYHVVSIDGVTGVTVDGFTIRDGHADGSEIYGGGMTAWNLDSSNSILNCRFEGNYAANAGAGLHIWAAAPQVIDCVFVANTAGNGGGGLTAIGSASPVIIRCTFVRNTALSDPLYGAGGGAIAMDASSSTDILDCVFSGNTAEGDGGAIWLDEASRSRAQTNVINCLFTGNSAGGNGGGLICITSSLTVSGCTFAANAAGAEGGAVFLKQPNAAALVNCIFVGNAQHAVAEEQADHDVTISHCLFHGNAEGDLLDEGTTTVTGAAALNALGDGSNNLSGDPRSVRDPDPGPDEEWGSDDDDYGDLRLREESPGIDTGDSDAVPPGVITDLAQAPRLQGDAVDIGAYEGGVHVPDVTPPTVLAKQPDQDSTITTGNLNVDVTFSEPVRQVSAFDLELGGDAAAGRAARVDTPTDEGGNTWRFPVSGLVNGPLTFELNGDITDMAGNDLVAVQWQCTVDIPAPAEIDVRGNGQPIAGGDTTPAGSDGTDFGTISTLGGSATHTFDILNLGGTELALTGSPYVTITGAGADAFTVVTEPSSPVVPGAGTTFGLRFQSTEAATYTATISIANGDGDENPYTFTVEGTAEVPTFSIAGTVTYEGNQVGELWVEASTDSAFTGDPAKRLFLDSPGAYELSPLDPGTYYVRAFVDWSGDGQPNAAAEALAVWSGDPANPTAVTLASDVTGLGLAVTDPVFAGDVIYVNDTAVGDDDGTSWDDAFTNLQNALYVAEAGDEIWVAEGVYRPVWRTHADEPRSATFCIASGVSVFGGFPEPGGSSAPGMADRTPKTYVTQLSGDIGAAGDSSDNAYHVVALGQSNDSIGLGYASDTTVDGVEISGGNADGVGYYRDWGGGLFALQCDSSNAILNCAFTDNAAVHGAGMAQVGSSVPLGDCRFTDNVSSGVGNGGGGLSLNSSSPLVNACLFLGNNGGNGGAVATNNSSATFVNCVVSGNDATYGAALEATGGHVRLANCTVVGNDSAPTAGFSNAGLHFSGSLTVANCIVRDNTPAQMGNPGGGTPAVSYSCVEGGYAGDGNLDEDPMFLNAVAGDFHLRPGSPCRDSGSNDAIPDGVTTDANGNARILNDTVDMGAFEHEYVPVPEIAVSGNGVEIASGDATPETGDHTDFGTVILGGDTVKRTFTVANSGDATLTLDGDPLAALSGPGAAAFAVTTAPAASVATDGETTFEVELDPAAAGTYDATVTIANNDPDEAPYTFAIRGRGKAASVTGLTLLPDPLDFGAVPVGESRSLTLTLRNDGNTTASMAALDFAQNGFACTAAARDLAAGATVDLSVTFTPAAAGAVPDTTLTVTAGGTAHEVTLRGSGVDGGNLLSAGSVSAYSGTTAEIVLPITLTSAVDLMAIGFQLTYDTSVLTAVAYRRAGRMVPEPQQGGIDDAAGAVTFAFWQPTGAAAVTAGTGVVAEVVFELEDEAPVGPSPVLLGNVNNVLTTAYGTVAVEVQHGEVMLTDAAMGDVDRSGTLTALDAIFIYRTVSLLSAIPSTVTNPDLPSSDEVERAVTGGLGDYNGDGSINALDAIDLYRHVSGLPPRSTNRGDDRGGSDRGFTLSCDSVSALAGATNVVVPIRLANDDDLMLIGFRLAYNTTVLDAVELRRAGRTIPDPQSDGLNDAAGLVTVALGSLQGGLAIEAGSGPIVEVVFDVAPGATADDYDLRLQDLNNVFTTAGSEVTGSVTARDGTLTVLPGTGADEWLWDATVSGAYQTGLQLGMLSGAEEGWDAYDLDTVWGPEDQGAVFSYQQFLTYERDMRPVADEAEWLVVVSAASEDVVLSWSSRGTLPDGKYLSLYEVDEAATPIPGPALDLERTASLTVGPEEFRYFVVRYASDLSVPLFLKAGWNLVSLPIEPHDPDVSTVFDTDTRGNAPVETLRDGMRGVIYTGPIWTWLDGGYTRTTELHALWACWVYVQADAHVMVRGLRPVSTQVLLDQGWNLLGPARDMAVPMRTELQGRCWRWLPDVQDYDVTDVLTIRFGHWLNAREAFTLDVGTTR